MAPGPRCEALDVPARPTRSAGHPDGNHRRHHHRTFERLGDLEVTRHRAVTTQVRTYLGRAPLHAGEGTHRVRLLPCRHGSPPPALRAHVHPPRHAARTARRRDRQAGRELGDPAGPQPLDGDRLPGRPSGHPKAHHWGTQTVLGAGAHGVERVDRGLDRCWVDPGGQRGREIGDRGAGARV